MQPESRTNTRVKTVLILAALLGLILGKGFLAFYLIGDRGMPGWDFRPVKAVPGESPYAFYGFLPHPRHIRGEKGK